MYNYVNNTTRNAFSIELCRFNSKNLKIPQKVINKCQNVMRSVADNAETDLDNNTVNNYSSAVTAIQERGILIALSNL